MADEPRADTDINIAVTKALALYATYLELSSYTGAPAWDPEFSWVHDPDQPLSLVLRS